MDKPASDRPVVVRIMVDGRWLDELSAEAIWKRLRADDPDLDKHLERSRAAIKAGKGVPLKELREQGPETFIPSSSGSIIPRIK